MKNFKLLFAILLCITIFTCEKCEVAQPVSSSGVSKANVTVVTDVNGHTIEQKNIMDRLTVDNKPGSIKHLYIISSASGQILMYSTVRGKVTSGSKRLTPSTVDVNQYTDVSNMAITIGNNSYYTEEVLGDDGVYGSSSEYIYWFDVRGTFHQQFVNNGGVVIHISDQPIAVKNIVINIEQTSIKE